MLQLASAQVEKAGQGKLGIKQAMNNLLSTDPQVLLSHILTYQPVGSENLVEGSENILNYVGDVSNACSHVLQIFDGLLSLGDGQLGNLSYNC